jgi:hypothetical protein
MTSNEIVDIYRKKLFNLGIDNVIVRIIHADNDICFNSDAREILYAIKDSIKYNNPKAFIYFKETVFGKAVIVLVKSLKNKNIFDDLIFLFIKCYLRRLSLVENFYKTNNIYHQDLSEKKNIITQLYLEVFNLNLPQKVTANIISYLDFNYISFMKVRDEYEKRKFK